MSKSVQKIETVDDAMVVIAELREQLDSSKVEGLQTENKDLAEKLSASEEKLEATQKAVSTKETEFKELAEKFENLEAKHSELETRLRNEGRFTKLAELGVELDDAKKQKYSAYSDETFDEVVAHIEQYKGSETKQGSVEANATKVLEKGGSDKEHLETGTTKPTKPTKDNEGFEDAEVDDADTVEDDESDDEDDDEEVEARTKVDSNAQEAFRKIFAKKLGRGVDKKIA